MLLKDRTIQSYRETLMDWETKFKEHVDSKIKRYQHKADLLKIDFEDIKGLYDELSEENDSMSTQIKDLKAIVFGL